MDDQRSLELSRVSLDEIGAMFSTDGRPSIDRRMLAAKADDVDATIKRLKAMSNGLRHDAAAGSLARRDKKLSPARRGKS